MSAPTGKVLLILFSLGIPYTYKTEEPNMVRKKNLAKNKKIKHVHNINNIKKKTDVQFGLRTPKEKEHLYNIIQVDRK